MVVKTFVDKARRTINSINDLRRKEATRRYIWDHHNPTLLKLSYCLISPSLKENTTKGTAEIRQGFCQQRLRMNETWLLEIEVGFSN